MFGYPQERKYVISKERDGTYSTVLQVRETISNHGTEKGAREAADRYQKNDERRKRA